jgi:hypothetical protein
MFQVNLWAGASRPSNLTVYSYEYVSQAIAYTRSPEDRDFFSRVNDESMECNLETQLYLGVKEKLGGYALCLASSY